MKHGGTMMPRMPLPLLPADAEALLLAFEAAWESGLAPDLEAFVPADANLDFVYELVLIDLERRTRAGLPVHVDAYRENISALNGADSVWPELVAAESALRTRLGARPNESGAGPTLLVADQSEIQEPKLRAVPVIPGYRVLRVLGTGGMSVVYEAQDGKSDYSRNGQRRVAIKLIKAGAFAGAEVQQRFRQEIGTLTRLQHVNVVTVLDSGTTADGNDYLVMEYLGGGRLPDSVRNSDDAARLIETLARAVGYLHRHNIVHRDLKPSNILLTADGATPKITDFGLAKCLETMSVTTTVAAGTPMYMPPEQVSPKLWGKIGPASDVYALGVMLYRFLCGAFPFPSLTPETVGRLLQEDPIPLGRQNPAVPIDLQTICHKCLERQPHRRYANGDELADDLENFRHRRRISARSVSLVGRVVRQAERNPPLAAVVVLLLTTLFAGVGVGVWGVWRYTADLKNAKEVAEVSRQEADRQRRLALENLRLVIAEINDLENTRPELDDVRQELLMQFQQLLSPLLDDPAHSALADETDFWIEIDIGDVCRVHARHIETASVHYRRALEIAERVAADPHDRTRRRLRSFAVSRLADVDATNGRLEEALDQYREMLALREELHAAGADRQTRADLAVAHWKIGGGYRRFYDATRHNAFLNTAHNHFVKSHEHYLWLTQEYADSIEYARMLGYSSQDLAEIHVVQREWDRAIEVCQSGLESLRSARDRFPACATIFDIQSTQIVDRLAAAYREIGQFRQAQALDEENLRLRMDFVQLNPRSNLFKLFLAHSYDAVGDSLRGLNCWEEAIASYEKGCGLYKEVHAAAQNSTEIYAELLGSLDRLCDLSYLDAAADEQTVQYSNERIALRRTIVAFEPGNAHHSSRLFFNLVQFGDYQLLRSRVAEATSLYQQALEFSEAAREITSTSDERERLRKRLEFCARANQPGFDPPAELLELAGPREFQMRLQDEFYARNDHVRLARMSEHLATQSNNVAALYAAARGFARAAGLATPGGERQTYDRRCEELIARLFQFGPDTRERVCQDPTFIDHTAMWTTEK